MAHKLTLAILGLPGAGKSTLCRSLAARFGWHYFLLGEALRDRASRDSALAELLGRGDLAPEDVVINLVQHAALEQKGNVLLLDGFPRHPAQIAVAKDLFHALMGLLVEVPREVVSARLAARRTCNSCGWAGLVGGAGDPCPICGATLAAARPEDTPPVLSKRLDEAERRLAALLAAWGDVPLLRVNGTATPDEVVETVFRGTSGRA